MKQLEVLQFATTLDITMGYYTIQLDEKYKYVMTIVTEFGKLQYNVLPMGLGISGDIFQTKVNKILVNIKGVKTYIDYMLVLNKVKILNNVEQPSFFFTHPQSRIKNQRQELQLRIKLDSLSQTRYHKGRSQT